MPSAVNRGGDSPKRLGAFILLLIVVAAIIGGVTYGRTFLEGLDDEATTDISTYTVEKGELLVTVTEDGNVESAKNVDIKCKVAGGSAILWIIDDGSQVQKGEKIIELDASSLEDQINTQLIAFNKAKTTVIQAEKDFEVAKISVKEYIEGTFVKELEDAETQITIAEENLRSSKNTLEYSEKIFQRGYISELELESQQFAVKRAQLELNSAKTAKKVLEEFTKEKTLQDLNSQVETTKATMDSERAAFDLEEGKLERLKTQLENCTIVAPQNGMVVFANERGGRFGQQNATIEEGAAVRDRQTLVRLPDLATMQVKVNVHETKVEDVEPGMRARVVIQGRDLQGQVVSVANQPEATSFFQGNVKEYATIVRIDGTAEDLKPGMTAEVEILIAHLNDVNFVPVSCVVELRGEYFVWVQPENGSPEQRKVELGVTNDQFVEIKSGLDVGEQVVRNPRAFAEEVNRVSTEVEAVDVSKKFGDRQAIEKPSEGRGGPSEGRGRPEGSRPGSGEGRPGGGGRGGFDLNSLDKDGDGKISKDEAPEQMQRFFDRMDGNSDGFIDKAEIDAMRSRMSGGGGGRRPGSGGGERGQDGGQGRGQRGGGGRGPGF